MSEDMLNVMGSFISTELDTFENLHKELEEKDKEIERLNKIKKDSIEFIDRYLSLNIDEFNASSLFKKLREILTRGDDYSKED